MAKVVLGFTGSLESSVSLHWLRHTRGMQVLAYSANLGGGYSLDLLGKSAVELGAVSAHSADLRDEFAHRFVLPALRAAARYESGYYLSAALAQPLLAQELVRVAREEGCEFVAHGCTAGSNDQVRLETSIASLAPDLTVIAPLREYPLQRRMQRAEYAERYGVTAPTTPKGDLRLDVNLWGACCEVLDRGDAGDGPAPEAHVLVRRPEDAPPDPLEIDLRFEQGDPVALNGEEGKVRHIVEALNHIGGLHGVGRVEIFENRLTGAKGRETYEAPAAAILYSALAALYEVVASKELLQVRRQLADVYADLIYRGLWFHELRECLDAFADRARRQVSGDVRMRLYKGNATLVSRKSVNSLFRAEMSTGRDEFRGESVQGFIDVTTLPRRIEAARESAARQRARKRWFD